MDASFNINAGRTGNPDVNVKKVPMRLIPDMVRYKYLACEYLKPVLQSS